MYKLFTLDNETVLIHLYRCALLITSSLALVMSKRSDYPIQLNYCLRQACARHVFHTGVC